MLSLACGGCSTWLIPPPPQQCNSCGLANRAPMLTAGLEAGMLGVCAHRGSEHRALTHLAEATMRSCGRAAEIREPVHLSNQ